MAMLAGRAELLAERLEEPAAAVDGAGRSDGPNGASRRRGLTAACHGRCGRAHEESAQRPDSQMDTHRDRVSQNRVRIS
jgi:hypothetical protein